MNEEKILNAVIMNAIKGAGRELELYIKRNDFEIFKDGEKFTVHIYGGPYKTLNSLEESLDWAKGFN